MNKELTLTIYPAKSCISDMSFWLSGDTLPNMKEVLKELSWEKSVYNPMLKYKVVHTIHLYTVVEDTLYFPTGLLEKVKQILIAHNQPYLVIDETCVKDLISTPVDLQGVELRDYQLGAVSAGLEGKRGIFQMPPGSGKTEVMIALTASIDLPTIWLTHSLDLMHQTHKRFQDRLPYHKIGKVGGGEWKEEEITICMVQTLSSKSKKEKVQALLDKTQVLMIDEAHHAPSSTWYGIAMACNAPYRFGCSATPLSRDDGSNKMLVGVTGELLYTYGLKDDVNGEVFSKPSIVFVQYEDSVVLPTWLKDWHTVYSTGIINNTDRNNAILSVCKTCLEEERKTLVFVNQVGHGSILNDLLKKHLGADNSHDFIWGKDDKVRREEVTKKLQSGEISILITSPIFDEGVDIPEVDALVLAGGGKSTIKNIQRVGRGMRKAGKDLRVYDFDDVNHYILINHTKKRLKDYTTLSGSPARYIFL